MCDILISIISNYERNLQFFHRRMISSNKFLSTLIEHSENTFITVINKLKKLKYALISFKRFEYAK